MPFRPFTFKHWCQHHVGLDDDFGLISRKYLYIKQRPPKLDGTKNDYTRVRNYLIKHGRLLDTEAFIFAWNEYRQIRGIKFKNPNRLTYPLMGIQPTYL